jgi:hypothetical protein
MAANDFYNRPQYATPHNDHDYTNAPLPPLPSPSHSPYHDGNYPYSHPQYASSNTGKLHDPTDPYDDENSIPLSGRRAKHASATSVAPMLPHEQEDPFVRDADPRRKRKRRKDGWFHGKITWVCFVLSIIQIGVFIGEIVKNGMSTCMVEAWDAG